MEYSLSNLLEGYADISYEAVPHNSSSPAVDFVNPGLGQIVNLYQTFVPIHGQSIHNLEKKIETKDDIESNLLEQLKVKPEQSGSGEVKLDPEIEKSFLNPIVTESIVFPKSNTNSKRKNSLTETASKTESKKMKKEHKFKVV